MLNWCKTEIGITNLRIERHVSLLFGLRLNLISKVGVKRGYEVSLVAVTSGCFQQYRLNKKNESFSLSANGIVRCFRLRNYVT
jgi:hypothetical protein